MEFASGPKLTFPASPPAKAGAAPTANAAAPAAYASTGAGAGTAPDARNPAICAAS